MSSTIAAEITRISGNVSDALAAIANKGVTVPSGSNSDDLATLISAIDSGEGVVDIVTTLESGGDWHAITGTAIEGSLTITENGTYNVSGYLTAVVSIPSADGVAY